MNSGFSPLILEIHTNQVSIKTIQKVFKSVLSLFIISWATSVMHTNKLPGFYFILFIFVFILKDWCQKLPSCHCKREKWHCFMSVV